ncbi:MAG TPA: hypothetical protein VGY54_14065 [Polyangiaceae bacterium]|nr:hypothetical protein [Polyangiaceae bacterium]
MPSNDANVPGVSNLYRRGKQYVGRVSFHDDLLRRGFRRVPLGTTDKNEATALLAKLTGDIKVERHVPASRARKLTVQELFEKHFFPAKEADVATRSGLTRCIPMTEAWRWGSVSG